MLQPCLPPRDKDNLRHSPHPPYVLQNSGWTPSWEWNSDRPSRYQPLTWLNESLNNLACPQTLNMVSTALPVYCLLLMRIQLTFAAWAESLNTRDDGRGKTYRSCQKHLFVSLHTAVILFITIIKSILCTPLTKCDTTDHNSTTSYAQNTTAIQPTVYCAGIHRLLVVNTGLSASTSANNCQGQLQTPQSVSVLRPRHSPTNYRTTPSSDSFQTSKQCRTLAASPQHVSTQYTCHSSNYMRL